MDNIKLCYQCGKEKNTDLFYNLDCTCKFCRTNNRNNQNNSLVGLLRIWYRNHKYKNLPYTVSSFIKYMSTNRKYVNLHNNWDKKDPESKPRFYKKIKNKDWTFSNIEISTNNLKYGAIPNENYQRCSTCHKVKFKATDFHKSNTIIKNYTAVCIPCYDIYRHSKNGLITGIYGRQLESSRYRKHKKPAYTKEELVEWVFKQPNWDSLYKKWTFSNYVRDLTPSVARLDDTKGYSFDNIRLVTWKDNYRKQNDLIKKPIEELDRNGNIINTYSSVIETVKYFNYTSATTIVNKATKGIITNKDTYLRYKII